MKVIAVKLRQLGDTILWTSALAALRQLYDGSTIDLVTDEKYVGLFNEDTRFNHVYSTRNGKLNQRVESAYDLALNFHASPSSRKLTRNIKATKYLIHDHTRSPSPKPSKTAIYRQGQVMSAIERDLNVIRSLSWNAESPRTEIHPTRKTIQLLSTLKIKFPETTQPLVAICPESSRDAKQWAFFRYLELCQSLRGIAQPIIIYSSPKIFSGRSASLSDFTKVAHTLHTPTLDDLSSIIMRSDLWVGSDSGAKHLAVALGTPTVTLFGPESVGEWHGYPSPPHRVIRYHVACRSQDPEPAEFSWCGYHRCPLSSHACMNMISVDEVNEQVRQATDNFRGMIN